MHHKRLIIEHQSGARCPNEEAPGPKLCGLARDNINKIAAMFSNVGLIPRLEIVKTSSKVDHNTNTADALEL